jgi:hypothetical protein
MADHISTFDEDADGWRIVICSCGSTSPPLPDDETAADVWADHYAEAATADLREQLAAAHAVIRRYHEGWLADAESLGDPLAWYLESGIDDTDIDGWEPMTPTEAAVIRAATADPTPHPETDT